VAACGSPSRRAAPSSALAPPADSTAAREAAPDAQTAEPANARWVEGRVVFPRGTPNDEEAFVLARETGLFSDHVYRARVAADGRFRVAFDDEVSDGLLRLEARYLYLDPPGEWEREQEEELVLEPQLGARVVGRVRVPVSFGPSPVSGVVSALQDEAPWRKDEVPLGADLSFSFGGLVPGKTRLDFEGEWMVGSSESFELAPGDAREIEFELQLGVVLGGVVRDESGAPLEAVEVSARTHTMPDLDLPDTTSTVSAADGTFRLTALDPGRVRLTAERDGLEPLEHDLGRLSPGTRRLDLALVLRSGGTIAGEVRGPDGQPTEAELELLPVRERRAIDDFPRPLQARSDGEGRFAVHGLTDERYLVRALVRPRLRAEPLEVRVGTRDLVLTLSRSLTLRGRVQDERGAPLADFELEAHRPYGMDAPSFRESVEDAYHATDGSFALDGFGPGAWDLYARSRAHAPSEELRVVLPATEPVTLVVPREATLRGVVLDVAGVPVSGAKVALARASTLGLEFTHQTVTTDEKGAFRIEREEPGRATLRALTPAGVPGAALEVELVAGEELADLVLRLEPGGRLSGEAVGAAGEPLADLRVEASQPGRGFSSEVRTDAAGRFVFDELPAGALSVSARTDAGANLRAEVTLEAGQEARVRLEAPAGALRLHGRVSAGGRPLAAEITVRAANGAPAPRGASSARCDEDGRYELSLPGAGRYEFWLRSRGGAFLDWRGELDVPSVADFAYDVALALGRISGRVRDARGQPVAAIQVFASNEQGGSVSATTDDEGRYELEAPVGTFAVRAGGSWSGSSYAEARVSELALAEGAHLRDVDLVLVPGGALEGFVRDAAGKGVTRAMITSTIDGRVDVLGRTDERGAFRIDGLTPGALVLEVIRPPLRLREPVRVEVVAGETRTVELVVE